MALAIVKGKMPRAQKLLVYGPEGVGKSTTADEGCPGPVLFIDVEGSTEEMDVQRVVCITSQEVTDTIKSLTQDAQGYKTVVLDTGDWWERRRSEQIIADADDPKITSIESFGYGKGYKYLEEAALELLDLLDKLRTKQGVNVVILAHSEIKKFEQPDAQGNYDRYQLKMTKQVAPLFKEWADAVLFQNFVTRTVEDKTTKKKRGVGGKERQIWTTRSASHDAKNRHDLPDTIPIVRGEIAEALAPIFANAPKKTVRTAEPEAPAPTAEELLPRVREMLAPHTETAAKFFALRNLTPGENYDGLAVDYMARMLKKPQAFIDAMIEAVKPPAGEVAA